ncbi:hypothetical protein PM082_020851 [Marasmius tenuissimus]|nr:hypothetical protein PM082_020851 [Marasmius tenuissimus]
MARHRRNNSSQQQVSLSLLYPDRYDVDNDNESQTQEYTKYGLNLGAETPRTPGFILSRPSSRGTTPSGIRSPNALDESYLATQLHPVATLPVQLQATTTGEEPRGRLWRSSSFSEKHRRRNTLTNGSRGVDRDCGICCENAVNPARTVCCGKLYCTEHIVDWLQHPSSEGKCPSCNSPNQGILTLPSPSNSTTASKPIAPPPSVASSRPISRNEGGSVPVPSINVRSTSPESDSASSTSEDDSTSSPSSPEQSQTWELHHSQMTTTTKTKKSSHPPPIPMDREVVGNVLCLVGLIMAVWVLLQ